MLPRLFEEAGMRQTEDGSITVLQGRNVGGSTVHNLCYAFRTPDPILALWRDEHGLPSLTDAALAPSFERVERGAQGEADPRGRGQRAEPDRSAPAPRSSATRAS